MRDISVLSMVQEIFKYGYLTENSHGRIPVNFIAPISIEIRKHKQLHISSTLFISLIILS
jgi:hypothetical protein